MPKLDGSKGRSGQMENITVVLHLDGTEGVRARAECELQSLLSVQAQHPAAVAQPASVCLFKSLLNVNSKFFFFL